jgi:hypothetical protein
VWLSGGMIIKAVPNQAVSTFEEDDRVRFVDGV